MADNAFDRSPHLHPGHLVGRLCVRVSNGSARGPRRARAPRTRATAVAATLILLTGAGVGAKPDSLPPFVGTTVSQDALLQILANSRSRQFKPIGRTSVFFRMRTESRLTAGYKVKSRNLEHGYRSEIAAYRLSRLLLLNNVPPTIFRRATRKEIRARFHKDKLERWSSVRRSIWWEDDGTVVGAASYWIKGARRGLEKRRRQWQSWLRIEGTIPPGKITLAQDLSTMTVFDFLIGNWDRYSGGNILTDRERTRAVLVDHDHAFLGMNEKLYGRLLGDLTRIERFSKGLVDQLVVLDLDAIQHELARDPSHSSQPLLTDPQIAALLDRRATILSYIAALVEEHGEDKVLVFP